jgi:tetratricopeptide (TPR) repeat protein
MHRILRTGFLFLLCITFVLITSCKRNIVSPSNNDRTPDVIRLIPLEGKGVFYANAVVRKDLKEGNRVAGSEEMGTCKPYPTTLSKKFEKEIVKSKELYERGEYQEAASMLKLPLEREPNNPFILETYARALLKQNMRQESFVYYRRLIDILDSNLEAKKIGVRVNDVIVDCWFPDAYWKLGILLLDQGEWAAAAFEISRFFSIAAPDICSDQPIICIQAFSYMTEAYFKMNKYDVAKYYAKAVLKLDPSNDYVKKYLSKMQ